MNKNQIKIIRFLLTFLLMVQCPMSSYGQLVQLYNAGRDRAAQQIRSNFTKIDITALTRMQATNLEAIGKLELDKCKTFAAMQRDFELYEIVTATNLNTNFFGSKIESRLTALLGDSAMSTVSLREFNADQRALQQDSLAFKLGYGVEPPLFKNSMDGFPSARDWFHGATNFVREDVADLKSFAEKLLRPEKNDHLSIELRKRLSANTATLLGDYKEGGDLRLQGALASDLSRVGSTNNVLCPTNLLAGIVFSGETLALLKKQPLTDTVRLNILILLDAYPELSKERFKTHPGKDDPGLFSNYKDDCQTLAGDFDTVLKTRGDLAASLKSLIKSKLELEADQKTASKLAEDYKSALTAYGRATTNRASGITTNQIGQYLGRIQSAVKKADAKAQSLAQSGGFLAQLALITNELAEIDVVIGSMASTNSGAAGSAIEDPDVKRAAAVAVVLPGVLDKAINFEQKIRQPSLLGLLIDRDILSVKKEMAQRAIERQKRSIILHQAIFESLLAETSLLKDIQSVQTNMQAQFEAAHKTDPNLINPLVKSTLEAMGSTVRDSWRFELQRAFLQYAETVRVHQYRANSAQLELTQVTFQEANDASEGAAMLWNSLIADPINQLAQYHAGGVKPETIADILSKFFIGAAILAK